MHDTKTISSITVTGYYHMLHDIAQMHLLQMHAFSFQLANLNEPPDLSMHA